MGNVYQRLGVRTIINASGPATRLSGSIMPPEVAAAMQEASQYCIDIDQLQARASELIAEVTGAEAGASRRAPAPSRAGAVGSSRPPGDRASPRS